MGGVSHLGWTAGISGRQENLVFGRSWRSPSTNEVDPLVVEADQAGDADALGQRIVVGPREVGVHGVADHDRPVARGALVGAAGRRRRSGRGGRGARRAWGSSSGSEGRSRTAVSGGPTRRRPRRRSRRAPRVSSGSTSMRVYGLRGWTYTSSSSSNQWSIARPRERDQLAELVAPASRRDGTRPPARRDRRRERRRAARHPGSVIGASRRSACRRSVRTSASGK